MRAQAVGERKQHLLARPVIAAPAIALRRHDAAASLLRRGERRRQSCGRRYPLADPD
jgi:hypothetical protein